MASDHRGSDQPNAVLRGGPLDGETLTVKNLQDGIEREVDGWIYTYVPTGDPDDEYPGCVVFIYVGERSAAWLAGGLVG
ncbi:MAG: hypothetical protein HOW97_11020 [Catenulispora sp.]|nr:hypothetical protein [Catenulispora sp.]